MKYFDLLSSSWNNSVMTSRDNEEHVCTWGSARVEVSDQPKVVSFRFRPKFWPEPEFRFWFLVSSEHRFRPKFWFICKPKLGCFLIKNLISICKVIWKLLKLKFLFKIFFFHYYRTSGFQQWEQQQYRSRKQFCEAWTIWSIHFQLL